MTSLTLNGAWELRQVGADDPIPASVPGCVHTDLLAAGRIDDPYFRDNELALLWIPEQDWSYRRKFDVPVELLERDHVRLRCLGLDTLATIRINGEEVGRADNMFRTWEFDVREALRAGLNTIEIVFDSPLAWCRARNAERPLPAWGVGDHKLDGGGWIRKEPCNFGWDWGPMCTTSGIWRDIALIAWDRARLADVAVRQEHSDGRVDLSVFVTVEGVGELVATANLTREGNLIAKATATVRDGSALVHLRVDHPALWWPNNLGEQPFYELGVELSVDQGVLDADHRRIGLRTLRLDRHPDAWGESFQFVVNGVPFFAKGANWIPADTFATRVTRADYERLLRDAAAANMNMLRVWGGGIYEDDAFYELCDELGICVWQDFMFACATYPAFDDAFLANVRAEAEDNVRRLRHHACLALWCGNNELEQGLVGDEWNDHQMSWADYSRLFDQLLPEVVARLDPDRDYWPCSPHTPHGDRRNFNDPTQGDAHLWSVWHGRQPFEWYRTCEHRFNSEFGFQSFPEPRTVAAYTLPEERNITSYVMEHHQRSGIGNSTIIHYMLDWFRLPTAFESVLWVSQIQQAMAIKYAVEHWRRSMPRGMGTLYWQLNDCWPVASWSSIDSFGRWKALHYLARRFYAPLLCSLLEDPSSGTVAIWVHNDGLDPIDATVRWWVADLDGRELDSGQVAVTAPAGAAAAQKTIDVSGILAERGPRELLCWAELETGNEVISDNLALFARPKHLALRQPNITATVDPADPGEYAVRLTCERPALWCWLALAGADARWSDNFVHLRPGRTVEIVCRPAAPLGLEAVKEQLVVRSLFDTYQ